jgi:hypothetical protein
MPSVVDRARSRAERSAKHGHSKIAAIGFRSRCCVRRIPAWIAVALHRPAVGIAVNRCGPTAKEWSDTNATRHPRWSGRARDSLPDGDRRRGRRPDQAAGVQGARLQGARALELGRHLRGRQPRLFLRPLRHHRDAIRYAHRCGARRRRRIVSPQRRDDISTSTSESSPAPPCSRPWSARGAASSAPTSARASPKTSCASR